MADGPDGAEKHKKLIEVSLVDNIGYAADLSQYDPGCWTGRETQTLTFEMAITGIP